MSESLPTDPNPMNWSGEQTGEVLSRMVQKIEEESPSTGERALTT